MQSRRYLSWVLITAAFVLGGCSGEAETLPGSDSKEAIATPVTAAVARAQKVEELEWSVGRLQSLVSPVVAAEVTGRVEKVLVDAGDAVEQGQLLAQLDTSDLKLALVAASAEAKQLQALTTNQKRTVERYRKLRKEGTLSADALENAESQLASLREQLASAASRRSAAERNLEKAQIAAPIGGVVEERRISVGDFVDRSTPLFRVVASDRLRAVLPFPESALTRIRPGQEVRLRTPGMAEKAVVAHITAIRPMVASASTLYAIAELDNPGGWRPGASVSAAVVVSSRPEALVVPEAAVVRRPAGEVVYVRSGGRAEQRVVHCGVRRDGYVEVLEGLAAGEAVIVDGAGFLTDKAPVRVQE